MCRWPVSPPSAHNDRFRLDYVKAIIRYGATFKALDQQVALRPLPDHGSNLHREKLLAAAQHVHFISFEITREHRASTP
jgi:hypothetical protein